MRMKLGWVSMTVGAQLTLWHQFLLPLVKRSPANRTNTCPDQPTAPTLKLTVPYKNGRMFFEKAMNNIALFFCINYNYSCNIIEN